MLLWQCERSRGSRCSEAAAVGAPAVAVKLDISGTSDSLKLSPLFEWLALRWQSETGKSARVLLHVMTRSVLIFHLFEEEWSLSQGIGSQQGATHSQVLFSYYVLDLCDVLTGEWDVGGEVASCLTSYSSQGPSS